jgi:Zn-dependent peptidase ImmA (M78 family)
MRDEMRTAIMIAALLQSFWPELKPAGIIDRLARELGVPIDWTHFSDRISGFVWYDDLGQPRIAINSLHSDPRQLFTIAHELYHCLAGHRGGALNLALNEVRASEELAANTFETALLMPEELAANKFAAALLMPDGAVRKTVNKGGGPREIALEFGVSVETATKRLAELGYKPKETRHG